MFIVSGVMILRYTMSHEIVRGLGVSSEDMINGLS